MEWKGRQKNFHYSFFTHNQTQTNEKNLSSLVTFSWVTNTPFQIKFSGQHQINKFVLVSLLSLQYRKSNAVSVIFKLEKHNTRLFTQTVSQPRHREYCVFLRFIQKVLNFILLEVMFYLTIMDFTIFRIKVW